MEDYYAVLGCSNDAAFEELKRSYQNLLLKHHPDKAAQNKDDSNHDNGVTFIKIKKAWDVLCDDTTRKEYDARWKQRTLAQQWPVQDEVEFEDFDYNIPEERYLHTCRCGGEYVLTPMDAKFKMDYVNCLYCSLHVKVIYPEDEEEEESNLIGTGGASGGDNSWNILF